jgi:thiamine biosynthesis lipoprotein
MQYRLTRPFVVDDEEIIRILKENTELSKKTDNFFNPAMGKLIALWGFHEDNTKQSIPSSSAIKDYLTNMPLMKDLTITNNTC